MTSTTVSSPRHTISLLVSDKPGVLSRITLVFARRGFNIDSLVVSRERENFSRMNIECTGDPKTLQLMLSQLNKIVDVIHARDHYGEDIITKELALIKVNCAAVNRTEILQIADAFKARTVDISDTTMTFEITGESGKLNACEKMFLPYGIQELVRTGKVLMARGEAVTA